MDIVVDNVHIHVRKRGGQRMVFANGSKQFDPMRWNKIGYKWEFSDSEVSDLLKEREMEISNAIIMAERTKPL